MAQYLLHQGRNGVPLGVFFEDDHFYPESAQSHEAYGISVMEARGTDTDWADYAEQLASKSPSPQGMWDLYAANEADLEDVFNAALADTTYGDGD